MIFIIVCVCFVFVLSLIHVDNSSTHTVLRAWEFSYIIRYNVYSFTWGTTSLMGPLFLSPLGGPFSEVLL